MPRATFAGVTFDLLVHGLQDTHEGMTTVREIPGGAGHPAYVDLGGPLLHRRTVTILVDNEAPTSPWPPSPAPPAPAARLTHPPRATPSPPSCSPSPAPGARATGPQLCRTEWLFIR